jgi:Tfp pilus assembly protein FimV
MPRLRFFLRLLFAFLLCALAQAAELGDVSVRSHIGQPLVADIELTALADASAPVGVRLANADVFRGANLAMHPILANLTMSVMRRDGRQYLHVTSVRPVDSETVHLFLDLVEGSRRNVRAVTLWLTPDPAPPPPPPPPRPVPVPVPVPVATPEPQAPVERPRPARVIAMSGMSCPQPKFSETQIKACSEMDYKNGLLSAQIVELEDKVKLLQLAMDAKAEAPPEAKKAAAPPPPPPPPKSEAKAAHKEEPAFPWLLVAGGVLLLALIAGGVWFMLSRRKGKTVETAAADSVAWYSRLAAPFRRKAKVVVVAVEEAKDA